MLINSWSISIWIATECYVKTLQEPVTSCQETLWRVGFAINTWLTVENNHSICQISCHYEIVFDDKGSLLRMHDKPLNDAGSNDTLFGIQICRWLINEIDISWNTKCQNNGNALQFTTRQILNFLINKIIHFERLIHVSLELRVQERGLNFLEEQLADSALELWCDGLWLHGNIKCRHLFGS